MCQVFIGRDKEDEKGLKIILWRSIARCSGMGRLGQSAVHENHGGVWQRLAVFSVLKEYIQAPIATTFASSYALPKTHS